MVPRRASIRVAACAVGAALAMACGGRVLVVGDVVSDASAPAIPDGGRPPSRDAGRLPARDAASEASVALPFCDSISSLPDLCDDFDDGELGAQWDSLVVSTGGQAILDAEAARSAPRALRMTSAIVDTGDISNVLLRKSFAGRPRAATLAFAAKPGLLPSLGVVAIATLDLSTSHLLTLYLRDDDPVRPGPSVVEVRSDGKTVRHAFEAALPAGQWTTVSLEANAGEGTLTLRYGGKVVLSTAALERRATDGPTIRIGALVTGPAEAFRVSFDDVLYRQGS